MLPRIICGKQHGRERHLLNCTKAISQSCCRLILVASKYLTCGRGLPTTATSENSNGCRHITALPVVCSDYMRKMVTLGSLADYFAVQTSRGHADIQNMITECHYRQS